MLGAVTEGRKGLTKVEVKHVWVGLRAHGNRRQEPVRVPSCTTV